MTIEEAKQAIARKSIIQFIEEPDVWGIPTCLSDDETTIYFKPRGMGLFRLSARINKMEVEKNE